MVGNTMLTPGCLRWPRLSRPGGWFAFGRPIAAWQREGGDDFISGIGDLDVTAEGFRAIRQVEEVAWGPSTVTRVVRRLPSSLITTDVGPAALIRATTR